MPSNLTSEHKINGGSTSIAAFVGFFPRGPLNKAVHIASLDEFERKYGRKDLHSDSSEAVRYYFLNGGQAAWIVRVAALFPAQALRTGIHHLDRILQKHVNILCVPAAASLKARDQAAVYKVAVQYCEANRVFLIVDIQKGVLTLPSLQDWIAQVGNSMRSSNAAVYFPQLLPQGSSKINKPSNLPSSGAIAGVFARLDASAGIWKSPAGLQASLQGADAALNLGDDDMDRLGQAGINALRKLPDQGTVCWGARTFAPEDQRHSEFQYVPVRRLALFIEESISQGTQWAVFEPNSDALWAAVRTSIEDFMYGLFHRGAFQGNLPSQAFFVKCGRDTMTQNDIDNGRLNLLVGFAPVKPAEFVVIRIQLLLRG